MRVRLLKYIRCPICKNEFDLKIIKENNTEIEEGILSCKNCKFPAAITGGVVNLLFNLDADTLKEVNAHIKGWHEMFEKELEVHSEEEVKKSWAYVEQESSKDYGIKMKKIFKNAIAEANINKNSIILDLGAGTGWSTAQLAKISDYCIAVDLCKPIKLELSEVLLKNENFFFERCMANMMQLPFADECIDVVITMAALHHATYLEKSMYEISRVLKDKGKLILGGEAVVLSDYFCTDEECIKAKKGGFNEHQYSAYDWFKTCETAGLYAIDGTTSDDKLDKYYKVDKEGYQNPLPIFVKKSMQKKPLKVAFLSQEFSKNCNGGVCRYTYDLAHALAELGNEVHVITKSEINRDYGYRDGDVFVHEIVPESMDFLDLPEAMHISHKNLSYSYAAALKLLELLDTVDIQIVEAPLWDGEGFVFSLVNPIPLVIRLETPLFKVAEIQGWHITKDLKLVNWMEGETLRGAEKAIAISEDIGTVISTHHNIAQEKIELCPLGIEIPDERLLSRDKKKKVLDVLFVGRLEKRKGIETLFKAIPIVLEEVPDAQFHIVGKDTNLAPNGGSYREFLLQNLGKEYHKNVRFVGYVDDNELKDFYRNCDIFVAPSLYESFGLIYLEAMAWGKAVIGCNVGGVPEIVEDGETGILIPPEDVNALAEAIINLKDEKLRAKMGENGRRILKNDFSNKIMAENTYKIYRDVINVRYTSLMSMRHK